MAHGAVRGALTAWLGLVTLQAITTKAGAEKVPGLVAVVDSLVQRVLDPAVAGIPDHGQPSSAAVTPGTAVSDAGAAAARAGAAVTGNGAVAKAAASAAASAARFAHN